MPRIWSVFLFFLPALAQGMDLKTWVRESPGYQALLLQRAQAEATWEAAQKGLAPTLTPQGNYSRSLLGQESLALGLAGSVALPWGQAQDNLRGAEIPSCAT